MRKTGPSGVTDTAINAPNKTSQLMSDTASQLLQLVPVFMATGVIPALMAFGCARLLKMFDTVASGRE